MLSKRGPEGATPVLRVGSHLVILLVALAVLMVSRLQLPTLDIVEAPPDTIEEVIDQEYAVAPELAAEVTTAEVYGLTRAAVPITMIPERARTNVITHTVVPGDTLYGISQKYKLSAESIMFSNGLEKNPDLLSLGQKLVILPSNGILHTVGKNETLEKIAKTYKVTTEAIVTYPLNRLDPQAPQICRRPEDHCSRRQEGDPADSHRLSRHRTCGRQGGLRQADLADARVVDTGLQTVPPRVGSGSFGGHADQGG